MKKLTCLNFAAISLLSLVDCDLWSYQNAKLDIQVSYDKVINYTMLIYIYNLLHIIISIMMKYHFLNIYFYVT